MNFYISDTHFGHANVLKHDERPFADVEEMDRRMMELWNQKVSMEDDVYIVGDFSYRSKLHTPDWYLSRLNGHKNLVIGNHDKKTLDSPEALQYLENVERIMYITDGDKQICLCHYPMAEWYLSRHGSWLIYGHIHGSRAEIYEFMKTREHALNAGACLNHYAPVTFEELLRNNQSFQGLL